MKCSSSSPTTCNDRVTAMTRLLILASLLVIAACASDPHAYDNVENATVTSVVPDATPTPTGGAVYQGGTDLRLFEDLRARRAGDILSIRRVERTDAGKKVKTRTNDGSDMERAGPVR